MKTPPFNKLHLSKYVQGPLPALRATFSGDATGIPRFAPVRGEGNLIRQLR